MSIALIPFHTDLTKAIRERDIEALEDMMDHVSELLIPQAEREAINESLAAVIDMLEEISG